MAFVEWLPKNIKKFANAKPEEIIVYLTKLSETPEGKNEFNALVNEYKKSKQNIPMAQHGSKINYLVNKMAKGGPTDNSPRSVADTTFTRRQFPGEDGISYENTIHITRWPWRNHDNPAARWQSQHEEYTEHITPENDTLYFNTFYDTNHIGNKIDVYNTNENKRKFFDKFRNKKVWEDL